MTIKSRYLHVSVQLSKKFIRKYLCLNLKILINILEQKQGLICGTNADEEKKMNASYIISVARKLGCSVFLLPEDILEVTS